MKNHRGILWLLTKMPYKRSVKIRLSALFGFAKDWAIAWYSEIEDVFVL